MTLHSTIKDLASAFANQVLIALRAVSLDELVESASGAPRAAAQRSKAPVTRRKRRRRSAADLEAAVVAIVDALKEAKSGLRAEVLREKLGLARNELPLAVRKALSEKRIRKTGAQRATTYFVHEATPANTRLPARREQKKRRPPRKKRASVSKRAQSKRGAAPLKRPSKPTPKRPQKRQQGAGSNGTVEAQREGEPAVG
jgi:hypothetical protein